MAPSAMRSFAQNRASNGRPVFSRARMASAPESRRNDPSRRKALVEAHPHVPQRFAESTDPVLRLRVTGGPADERETTRGGDAPPCGGSPPRRSPSCRR